ncbi:MAG: hypothetical protein ACKVOR_13485, partial [Flavobacteriales bacterium]
HWNDSTRNAFNDSLHDLRMNALRTNTAKQWRSLRQWMLADSIRNHNVGDTIYRKFQFSLLPYVGTNRKMSPYCINDYSFSLLGGYCRAVRKVELGAFLNIVREEVDGIQLAGFANLVGGSVSGLQAAGFTNVVRGDVNGLQLAGFTNVNAGNATGAAFSGFVNVTKGNAVGVHGAGFINVVRGSTKGVLAAGFGNFSKGNMYGVQMAGFINTAMHVRGVQLGIINVCDSMQGVPIGLFNFVKKGYHTLEFSSNDIYRVNAAWRSGMRALYTITQAGVKLGKSNYKDVYSLGYGLGTSPRIMSWLYANIEATCNYSILDVYHIIDDEFYVSKLVKPFHYIHLDNQLYLGLDFRISKKFAVSSGALVHCLISENQYIYTNYFDSTLPQFFYHEDSGNTNMRMWLGWKVAIRFF